MSGDLPLRSSQPNARDRIAKNCFGQTSWCAAVTHGRDLGNGQPLDCGHPTPQGGKRTGSGDRYTGGWP